MAINSIPGVGPQNTDIATAVSTSSAVSAQITASVPTAAAIATAVAAPSLASITSAITTNAAPASVTMAAITSSITTNAASAGVTLAAIGTQVANNAPSPSSWVFLGSGNLQGNNSATFSFSAYRKLRIVCKFTNGTGGAQAVLVRFNGDTANNYTVAALVTYEDTYAHAQTNFLIQTDSLRMTYGNLLNGGTCIGWMEVNDANSTSAHKQVTYQNMAPQSSASNVTARWSADGIYRVNSAITSVTINGNSGTVFSAGEAYNAQAFQVFGQN